jgi:hypothetical protein
MILMDANLMMMLQNDLVILARSYFTGLMDKLPDTQLLKE